MNKKSIYIVQFGTGSKINLLPLAAGQLISRLKMEKEFIKNYNIEEIIFKKEDPKKIAENMNNPLAVGFSCSLWNKNQTLETAKEIKKIFPDALIIIGGPSAPRDPELSVRFMKENPFIDVLCLDEGEDVFTNLCKNYSENKGFDDISGIVYKEKISGNIKRNNLIACVDIANRPSPYLDGTFDEFYRKYFDEFSGTVLETTRGCPYSCVFCTWGSQPFKKLRERNIEDVKKEIEWIAKNKIDYIAMSDSNFGIRERDIDIARFFVECKIKYGFPNFVSVSWVKDSSDKVLRIAEILKENNIGFRITLSLQSLNPEVIRTINRINLKEEQYEKIKDNYRSHNFFSYTELILGLPVETYESYIGGIEKSLSPSIFDQLYIYPLFLFTNTNISLEENIKKYGIQSRKIENVYTKSKDTNEIKEYVDIVVGSSAMPKEKWIDSFVTGYYTLALHDDRLAFFILHYLKKELGIKITDLIKYAKEQKNFPVIRESFNRLSNCALGVLDKSEGHLIRPSGYGGIPFDPPEGIFLELLLDKDEFYSEFLSITKKYLQMKKISFDEEIIEDLFNFQNAIMSHPTGPFLNEVMLNYDWINYFKYTFHLKSEGLNKKRETYKIIDKKSSNSPKEFLKNHFDIRGVPPFNILCDNEGNILFPPTKIKNLNEHT